MQNDDAKSKKVFDYLTNKEITLLSDDNVRYCMINPYRFLIKHDTIQNRTASVDVFSVSDQSGSKMITVTASKKTNINKSALSFIKSDDNENIIIDNTSGEVIDSSLVKERKKKKENKTNTEIENEANRTRRKEIDILNANFYPSRRFHSAFLTLTFEEKCYDYKEYSHYIHDYVKGLKRHFKTKDEEVIVVHNTELGRKNNNLHCHMLIGFKNKTIKTYLPTDDNDENGFRNSVFQKLWKHGNVHIDLLHKAKKMEDFDKLFKYMTKDIKKIKLFTNGFNELGVAIADANLTPEQLSIRQSMQGVKVRCYNKSQNCALPVWIDTDYQTAMDKLSDIENKTVDKQGKKCDVVRFNEPVQSVSAFTINKGKETEEMGLHIRITYTRDFTNKHVYCELNKFVPKPKPKPKLPPQEPIQIHYCESNNDDYNCNRYGYNIDDIDFDSLSDEDRLLYEEIESGMLSWG